MAESSEHKTSDRQAIRNLINNLIQTKKIVMFIKDYCPYCKKAIQLIRQYESEFPGPPTTNNNIFIFDLNDKKTYSETQLKEVHDVVKIMTRENTVPQIWINSEYVGGYSNLLQYIRTIPTK